MIGNFINELEVSIVFVILGTIAETRLIRYEFMYSAIQASSNERRANIYSLKLPKSTKAQQGLEKSTKLNF